MWSYQFLCFVRQCSLFNQWRCFNHNRSSSLRLFIWFPMLFHAILAQAFREHQSLQGYLKEWGLLLSNWRHSYRHLIEHSLIFFIRHRKMCRSSVYNRGFRGIKKPLVDRHYLYSTSFRMEDAQQPEKASYLCQSPIWSSPSILSLGQACLQIQYELGLQYIWLVLLIRSTARKLWKED